MFNHNLEDIQRQRFSYEVVHLAAIDENGRECLDESYVVRGINGAKDLIFKSYHQLSKHLERENAKVRARLMINDSFDNHNIYASHLEAELMVEAK
jgi:hypothetical protein